VILAKTDGTSLRKHTEDVLNAVSALKKNSEPWWKLVEFVATFLDAGKVYPVFQKKIGNKELAIHESLPDVPHSFLSILFVPKEIIDEFDEDDVAIIFSAIAFHHWRGNFLDYLLGEKNYDLRKACRWLLENKNLIESLRKEIPSACFNETLAETLSCSSILNTGVILPPHIIYTLPGFLSNTLSLKDEMYKKYIFVTGNLMRVDRFASMAERENVNIKMIDIECPHDKKNGVAKKLQEQGYELWQLKTLENSYSDHMILVAPTGSGKTEFSLLWGREKVILTLPLRSAVNSIYDRLKEYFGSEYVGLLHSNADLVIFEKLFGESAELEGEVFRHLHLSRFLSFPYIVTTGDQIFPSALKYPGYEIIYATLMEASLIVDEVQAYEPYTAAIIVKLLEDAKLLGGKFLLMTATLPTFIKNELLTRTSAAFIDAYKILNDLPLRSVINVRIGKEQDFIDMAIRFFAEGKRVLIMRNTVTSAINTYKELVRKGVKAEIIHSKLTFDDRRKKEEALKEYVPGKESKPIVLVSTQVAEASLNIDFDVLITDIAPADSLVQRMGRVFRKREYKGSEPNVFIIVLVENGKIKTFKGVYGRSQIITTLAWLNLRDALQKKAKRGWVEAFERKLLKQLKKPKNMPLSESEKRTWVEETYEYLLKANDSYIKTFCDTLDLLDSGFFSETRIDSQRIFRRIVSFYVVPDNLAIELIGKLETEKSLLKAKELLLSSMVPIEVSRRDAISSVELYTLSNERFGRYFGRIPILKGYEYERGVGIKLS